MEIIVNVSNRHMHLTRAHLDLLFGKGYKLTVKKVLMEPSQFAANETLTVIGRKGEISNVRVIGPEREYTQLEISATDAVKLGIDAPVRLSGDISGSAAFSIKSENAVLELKEGCIIAKRHAHFPASAAQKADIKHGQELSVKIGGTRGLVFNNVIARIDKKNSVIECHVDFDEANAALIKNGTKAEIIK